MQLALLLAGLLSASLLRSASAGSPGVSRNNATDALAVFMITDCNFCTSKESDSIFCTEAAADSNFVSNGTATVTIQQKKRALGASDGAKYCWAGTFGGLRLAQITNIELFGSVNASANVGCSNRNLYYRQCFLSMELAIIFMAIGGILVPCLITCCLFQCGCCKRWNLPGDDSKYGLCNRYCPWMPCAEPMVEESKAEDKNPDEDERSLFARTSRLQASTPGGVQMTTNPVQLAGIKKL